MAIKKFREPDEALIRYVNGVPAGIHLVVKTGYTVDGVLDADSVKLMPAEEQDMEGFQLSELFGDITKDALAEVTRLNALVATLNETIIAKDEEIEQAKVDAAVEIERVKQEADTAIRQVEADSDIAIGEAQAKAASAHQALTQAAEVAAAGLQSIG